MSVNTFREHLVTLHTKGEVKVAYSLKGKVNIAAFTRSIRDKMNWITEKGEQAPEYHYMWFMTADGAVFYATGSERFMGILEDVVKRTKESRKTEFECTYRGVSRDLFLLKIARDLPEYKTRKGKPAFGGNA